MKRYGFLSRTLPLAAALLVLAVVPEVRAQHRGGHGGGHHGGGFSRGYAGRGFSVGVGRGYYGRGFSVGVGRGYYGRGFSAPGLYRYGGYGLYGRGYYRPRYGLYGSGNYGYAPYGYSVYSPVTVYTAPDVVYSTPAPADLDDYVPPPITPELRGYYNPADLSGALGGVQGSRPAPTDGRARIEVRVPANALVYVEGDRTAQTGPTREFESPKLDPGKDYQYEVRARWTENGRSMEQVRSATVRANQVTVVDFTRPAPARPEAAEEDVPPVP